jgi:hypothetical protein
MIHHHTIKFAPAASHKELMKKLHEGLDLNPDELKKLAQVKVVVEAVCDPEDLKSITALVKSLSTPPPL